jgi:dCTP diphosphatase
MNGEQFLNELREFIEERDWSQFHSAENLSKSIAIEAAELLELFQWSSEVDKAAVADELADVLTYCMLLADKYGFDIIELVSSKLEKTKLKYPVDSAKGKSTKYDRL